MAIERITGIVTDVLKHSDRHNIVTVFTRERGRMALLSSAGQGKAARVRNASLLPLSVISADVNINPGRELQFLGRFQRERLWKDLYFSPVKSAIALFLSEFLNAYVRNSGPDPHLFDFLLSAISRLDALRSEAAPSGAPEPAAVSGVPESAASSSPPESAGSSSRFCIPPLGGGKASGGGKAAGGGKEGNSALPNFHLAFLIEFMDYAGIRPDLSGWREGAWFDMRGGSMSLLPPSHRDVLPPPQAAQLPRLARMNLRTARLFRLTGAERREILAAILRYYGLHFPGLGSLRSPQVLTSLFT